MDEQTRKEKAALLEERQIYSLRENYKKFMHLRQDVALRGECPAGMEVHFHQRPNGGAAYYIVLNGTPIGYCVGYKSNKKMANGAKERHRFIIASTFILEAHRRSGFGLAFYKAILGNNDLLVSDWDQGPGAVALWSKLRMELSEKRVMSASNRYYARNK